MDDIYNKIFTQVLTQVSSAVSSAIKDDRTSDISGIINGILKNRVDKVPPNLCETEENVDLISDDNNSDFWTDERGVKYSADHRRLLKAPVDIEGAYQISSDAVEIQNNAFANCAFLKSIQFPSSLMIIGSNAFLNCQALSSISLSTDLVVSMINDYHMMSNFQQALRFQDSITLLSSKSPNSIKWRETHIMGYIGDSAFKGCTNLKSISIPNFVVSIGNCAFQMCSSIENVHIPDSVVSIKIDAFAACAIKTVSVSRHTIIDESFFPDSCNICWRE